MVSNATRRPDEPSPSALLRNATLSIFLLGGLLFITGIALLLTGFPAGGLNSAIGGGSAVLAALVVSGRQGYSFLGSLVIPLGVVTALSWLVVDYSWPGIFINLFAGLLLAPIGGFLIGEGAGLRIPLETYE